MQQAARLNTLTIRGWKLQATYLQNAREKGVILAEVQRRLDGTTLSFAEWVRTDTTIGLSTAYLWIEVAEWWDEIKAEWEKVESGSLSNPLETSLRGFRSLVQHLKKIRGLGKARSGKKSASCPGTPTPAAVAPEAKSAGSNLSTLGSSPTQAEQQVDAEYDSAMTAPAASTANDKDTRLFEPAVTISQGGEAVAATSHRTCKLTVMTPAKADLTEFGALLPSPITDFKARSVTAWVAMPDIDKTLAAVASALRAERKSKLRITIEL